MLVQRIFLLLLVLVTGCSGHLAVLKNAKTGDTWSGTKQLGVAGTYTFGYSVATDSDGNVFVTGSTDGPLDGNTLAGTGDSFVTKYGADGAKQWTRQLGVAGASTAGNGVATDAGGNVFVAGATGGPLDGNTLTGGLDFFVTKYDANGAIQWTRQLGVEGTATFGKGVATGFRRQRLCSRLYRWRPGRKHVDGKGRLFRNQIRC